MMKKRKSPTVPGDNQEDDDSEMVDVDGEEKIEVADEDSDDAVMVEEEEDEEEEEREAVEDNSFMDTFYGLSSSNPVERAQAANALLHHCLIGPQANAKDATYALRRLLNGLCSGRAASRQGNASALASFLKISLEGGQLDEIKEQDDTATTDSSILDYVRERLLKATDPSATQGKKKGSEERDYQFGRLFGILSVARSGILLSSNNQDQENITEVATGFVTDLVQLYNDKKWMREPAAHAIGTILRTFYADSEGKAVAVHLVEQVVIPKLVVGDDDFDVTQLEAEKIAIIATIQAHAGDHPNGLPAPLDEPVITSETMSTISKALVETSSVTLPRTHLVWDSLWLFLTERTKQKGAVVVRELRKDPLIISSDSARDIMDSLVQRVILEGLLRVDPSEGPAAKTTHEKRALALCLVRNMFGVPFNSSITGPTQLQLEVEDLERILSPVMIRRLFLDVLCAGGGSSKKAHTLKPLALQILGSIVDALSQDTGMNRRLRLAKVFVQCEPRFDSLTKTTTTSDLVGLSGGDGEEFGEAQMDAVTSYLDFLKTQMLSSSESGGELLGYIDSLYHCAKKLLTLASNDESTETTSEAAKFALKTVEGVVGFLMAGAFFDCQGFTHKTPKKSKKSKAKSNEAKHFIVEVAKQFNQLRKEQDSPLSYPVRSILSERFYSLLAEYVHASMHSGRGSTAKDSTLLEIVEGMCNGWKTLESGGAKPLFPAIDSNKDEDDDEAKSPADVVSELQKMAQVISSASETDTDAKLRARKRCATGCAALASTLFLHLLGCGKPDDLMDEDEITTEDDDDSADILDAIEEIGEVAPLILESIEDADGNPLTGFAEVCMGVLSSRLSGGNPGRGASSKLLREAVKFAWMGVLSVSATADRNLLDSDTVTVLLTSIGADQGGKIAAENEEEEEEGNDSDEEMEDEDDSDNELGDFSKVGKILDGEDEDDDNDSDDDGDKEDRPDGDDADNDDEEINQERLTSLLEDDSDAGIDMGELEHHAGADAALAMLIKVKQEARKASRQARERLEIEKQIRCTLLLETLLSKSESWAPLFRSDVILQMLLPMLTYRSHMEKSLSSSAGKAKDSSIKKAMLDRLSSILKTKLFKLKLSGIPASESVDIVDCCSSLAASVLDMVRASSSKDQRSCCSAGLAMIVKAAPDTDGVMKVASVYASAVEEWSTKRTSHLQVSLFDDLIGHCPSVSQMVLVPSLVSAISVARSPFLRCECFRLLSILFNPKLNPQSSELDALALKKMRESASEVIAPICNSLTESEDMQTAKRVKDVLKATEKVLDYAKSSSCKMSALDNLTKALDGMDAKLQQNQGTKNSFDRIKALIDDLEKDAMNVDKKADKAEGNEEETEEADGEDDSGKKDKKKKKKKKKRGKK
ncbi:MYB binding protein (P160) 1a [Seminavis robusta]|uniref:MYB binding protein (P160) 1a n=1 Tax=Seminavis robusta TaxID=568900 RepID=A0A9N8DUP6_9STRA|nr:MYB binding protein (P160) 1a [Seminavis robusta]|eukprot:Sro386_g131810.1 MYB binding protein (P160) 1a (1387) ;mRNA; f:4472-8703